MHVFPNNVAVYEGDTVTLMCYGIGLKKNSRWFRSSLDRVNNIFTGNQIVYPALYAVNTSLSGQFDLVIKSITMAMAGKYICNLDTELTVSAEVVVFGEFENQARLSILFLSIKFKNKLDERFKWNFMLCLHYIDNQFFDKFFKRMKCKQTRLFSSWQTDLWSLRCEHTRIFEFGSIAHDQSTERMVLCVLPWKLVSHDGVDGIESQWEANREC